MIIFRKGGTIKVISLEIVLLSNFFFKLGVMNIHDMNIIKMQ